jgi:RND family efflux transporter MFP subunit
MSILHPDSFLDVAGLAIAAGLVLGACGPAKDAATGATELPGGAVTLWTDSTELFMEHPALIVGAPDKFAVHLTDLTDFAPLRSGRIELRFVPRGGGAPVVVTQEEPRAPGIYGPAPRFTQPGIYDLTITVAGPQIHDVIEVPNLVVYAQAADVPPDDAGEQGIRFLKEQQWKTPGFATDFARAGSVQGSFEALGQVIPAAGRMARLAAPVAGVVEVSGVAEAPAPGQRVSRGQALAILTPALGEGGSALAKARAELREAEHEFERTRRLYAAEAIPLRRHEEAEIRLTAAREALTAFGGGNATLADGRIVIRAPINGVIAARTITPGSRVDAGTELFTIVDPSVVWLEANVPAADAGRVGRGGAASFRVPGSDRVFTTRERLSVGSIIDSVSRTVPVLYQVGNRDGALKVGMTAQVAIETGQAVDGVVIPASAVLEENGQPVAYVQLDGEHFEKRNLTLGGSQGARVLVASGIKDGERVVTGAAYQVRLASLSTSVPEHGHEH